MFCLYTYYFINDFNLSFYSSVHSLVKYKEHIFQSVFVVFHNLECSVPTLYSFIKIY